MAATVGRTVDAYIGGSAGSAPAVPPSGSAAASWRFSGIVTSGVRRAGSAAGTWAASGAAQGGRRPGGSVSASWSARGTARGSRRPRGTSTAAVTWTGRATGRHPTPALIPSQVAIAVWNGREYVPVPVWPNGSR